MSIRTPLARVEGLGTARSGSDHFWHQRISAAALVLLSLWLVVAGLRLVGAPHADVIAFLSAPINAILMLLFILAAVFHMMLGIQVVIEDYVPNDKQKVLCLALNRGFGWAVGVACVFAMLKIAL